MDPITLALVLSALAVAGTSLKSSHEGEDPNPEYLRNLEAQINERLKDASKITVPDVNTWVQVPYGNDVYLVAPRYIAPVGIGEAKRIADSLGYQLPTKGLVDAIYKAADLKLDPHPRGQYDKPPSDFTAKTMNSNETHVAQLAYIQKQLEAAGNPNYKLLAGTHKDVIFDKVPYGKKAADGQNHMAIYGWHQRNGKPIQDVYAEHASGATPATDWKDYSQGLRLVKKIT